MSQNGSTSANGITEDEAALYDRQIRLWGVEAQNKMRTSSVLLVTLRGIAAEVAKNIVLAGIGSLTLLDDREVTEDDLGANFFLREEDVGRKRVEAAAPRIQALNPRVQISTSTSLHKLDDPEFLAGFSIIVVTEVAAPTLLRLNEKTRKAGKKLVAASSLGMDGWIFADLLDNDFMVDKVKTSSSGQVVKMPTKMRHSFVPFSKALEHKWTGANKRTLKRIQPSLWAVLALFKAQIESPDGPVTVDLLTSTAESLLPSLDVPISLLQPDALSRIARTATAEFPPTAAIVGGLVGQDVLNALGGKEEPVRNFMVFEGSTGLGGVFQLGCD